MSATLRPHVLHPSLNDQIAAAKVDVHHAVPNFRREFVEIVPIENRCEMQKAVDPAKFFLAGVYRTLNFFLLRNIRWCRQHPGRTVIHLLETSRVTVTCRDF